MSIMISKVQSFKIIILILLYCIYLKERRAQPKERLNLLFTD